MRQSFMTEYLKYARENSKLPCVVTCNNTQCEMWAVSVPFIRVLIANDRLQSFNKTFSLFLIYTHDSNKYSIHSFNKTKYFRLRQYDSDFNALIAL